MYARLILMMMLTVSAPAAWAGGSHDSTLDASLQSCEVHGIHACLRILYPRDPVLATRLEMKMQDKTRDLGDIVGTEVVFARSLSKQVQRFYVAIYFEAHPLWLRIDRYMVGVKKTFLPLEFSTVPEDILPAEILGR